MATICLSSRVVLSGDRRPAVWKILAPVGVPPSRLATGIPGQQPGVVVEIGLADAAHLGVVLPGIEQLLQLTLAVGPAQVVVVEAAGRLGRVGDGRMGADGRVSLSAMRMLHSGMLCSVA